MSDFTFGIIISLLTALFLGIGGYEYSMLSVHNPKRIAVARVCFIISAIFGAGVVVMLSTLIDTFWLRSIIVFVLFGFLGVGLVEMYIVAGHTEKIEESAKQPIKEQLEEPTFTEGIDAVSFTVGSNSARYGISDLEKAKKRFFIGDVPALLYAENGKPYFDVEIYSPNHLPVRFRHNQLLNRPADWDMNSDNKAIEVINERGQPVFQLYHKSPSQMVINGLFFNGHVPVLASDDEIGVGIDLSKEPYPIKPLFKYPSSEYPSQRQ